MTPVCPVKILLVEDSPTDALLTREALEAALVPNELIHVRDGMEAMAFLRREGQFSTAMRPSLILLDLNLPRMNGLQVLRQIKGDKFLKTIPVVVLSTSKAESDVMESYQSHANSYVTKPVEFDHLVGGIGNLHRFWLSTATLPQA
jgi:CheY-like chemotaxis protein